MPYLIDKNNIRLPKSEDRRVKISDEDRSHIASLYSKGVAVREIVRRMDNRISRRSIQFILFPERLEHLQNHNREIEHWKIYYNRSEHNKAMRKTRKHRAEVFNVPSRINTQ
jgi:hypothetical protein